MNRRRAVWVSAVLSFLKKTISFLTLEAFLLAQAPAVLAGESDLAAEPVLAIAAAGCQEVTLDRGPILVTGDQAVRIRFREAELEIPAGAVSEPVRILIEELPLVAELDPGMHNVTGHAAGYRFLPHGLVFAKPVRLTLPYDRSSLGQAAELETIHTYFFNEQEGVWERLQRLHLDAPRARVTSLTTHFTDFINSTLTLPQSPETLDFNPNSIKEIKAADPASGIPALQGLEGGPFGAAQFSLPIVVPPGRSGLQPRVSLDYNSGGGNGWLGVGFDIAVPHIAVDTRFGVPAYDGYETYLLNGAELVADRVEDGELWYRQRVEGPFQRIIRKGTEASDYWFEVTEKDGTRHLYGTEGAVLQSYRGRHGIFKWYLKQTTDANGNTIGYEYFTDEDASSAEPGRQVYLQRIRYTGHVSGAPAKYSVEFLREADREDRLIDARGGFKTITRHRLREMRVLYDGELIRSYLLEYGYSEFRKSQLTRFSERDRLGQEFYAYSFTYFQMPQQEEGYQGFQDTTKWLPGGQSTLTTDQSLSVGGGVYASAGVGLGPCLSASIGAYAGFSFGWDQNLLSFTDINGDGLPDQVFKPHSGSPLAALLNTGNGFAAAPVSLANFSGYLGSSRQSNLRFSISGGLGPLSGSGGITFSDAWDTSALRDIDGDGFVDIIPKLGASYYLRNLGGTSGFETRYWQATGQTLTAADLAGAAQYQQDVNDSYHLLDPVRRWLAPHSGTVQVSGEVRKEGGPDAGDGVKVNLYHRNDSIFKDIAHTNETYWQSLIPDDAERGRSILLREDGEEASHSDEVQVARHDPLYFKVNSIRDITGDVVRWDPRILYTQILAHDAITDPGYTDYYDYPLYDSQGNLVGYEEQKKLYYRYYQNRDVLVQRGGSGEYFFDLEYAGGVVDAPGPGIGTTENRRVLVEILQRDTGQQLRTQIQDETQQVLLISDVENGEIVRVANVDSGVYSSRTVEAGREVLEVSESHPGYEKLYRLTDNFADVPRSLAASDFREVLAQTGSSDELDFLSTWYLLAEDLYLLQEGATEEQKLRLGNLLHAAGYHDYDLLYKRIRMYADRPYSVTYLPQAPAAAEEVVADSRYEDSAVLGETSYILVEDFDETGVTREIRSFLHVFHAAGDFHLADLIQEALDEAVLQEAEIPAGERPKYKFHGGVYNWCYGEWNGSIAWDENLLQIDEEYQLEVLKHNYLYFNAMSPEAAADSPLGEDIWKGTQTKYTEKHPGEDPEEVEMLFLSFSSRTQFGASAKGGQAGQSLPSSTSTISLDSIDKIRECSSTNTNVGGGLSFGIFGGSVSFSRGSSTGYRDLFDINGDRYPDQIVFPADSGELTALLNHQGEGYRQARQFDGVSGSLRNNVNENFGLGVSGGALGGAIQVDLRPSGNVASASPEPSGASACSSPIGLQLGFNGSLGQSVTKADFIDINGDGLPDHVGRSDDAEGFDVRLNLGDGFGHAERWNTAPWSTGQISPVLSGFLGGTTSPENIRYSTTVSGGFTVGVGLGPVTVNVGLTMTGNRTKVDLIDMNGDGLPDQVLKLHGRDYFLVRLNTGDRFGEEIKWHTPAWEVDGDGFAIENYVENFLRQAVAGILQDNFDGLGGGIDFNDIDIDFGGLDAALGELANDINIFGAGDVLNYTGGFSIPANLSITITFYVWPLPPVYISVVPSLEASYGRSSAQLLMADINGDGLPDHLFKYDLDDFYRVKLNNAGKVGLLKEVLSPLGGRIALDYERCGNTVDMPSSQWVLSQVTRHDGLGNNYPTFLDYTQSGYYDRAERVFYGFGRVVQTNADGSTVESLYHNRGFYTKGLLARSAVRDAAGKIFRKTVNYYVEQPAGAAVFPSLARSEQYFYDGDSTDESHGYTIRAEEYSYDAYGNIRLVVDAGSAADSQDDLVLHLLYREDRGRWILSKPILLEARDQAGTLLRERMGSYDERGNLVKLEEVLAEGENPESRLAYDLYGNLITRIDPKGYTLRYRYDSEVFTYIVEIEDSFGYRSTASYDARFGVETESVDLNGNRMRRKYDGFGRLQAVYSPYDGDLPAAAFAYYPQESPARAVTRNKVHFDPNDSETLDTVLVVDALRRVIQTKKEGEVLEEGQDQSTYGMNVTGRVLFDVMGRVAQQGQPVFQPGYDIRYWADIPLQLPTHTEYDILGRTTRVTLPDESVIHTEYGVAEDLLVTRVIDPEGKEKVSRAEVRGNTVAVEQLKAESWLATRYTYNPLSEITSVIDAAGNITLLGYDTLGRRTFLDSQDAGRVESFYDASGNLTRKVDANLRAQGEAIEYRYEYNRLAAIDYPRMADVAYAYGEPGASENRAGRLVQVVDSSGITTFSYGKLGEEVQRVRRLVSLKHGLGDGTYMESRGFDYLGRVEWLQYPDGERLSYAYDRGGQIVQAVGEKQGQRYEYVRQIGYDAFGQRVLLRYGNGVQTRYRYDPARRWLQQIHTQTPGSEVLQDCAYGFDRVGNVLELNNAAAGVLQRYGYDDLHQLVQAQGQAEQKNQTLSYRQEFAYDPIGNLLRKTSVALREDKQAQPKELNYELPYVYAGDRPHAASRIGDQDFRYDPNGNLVEVWEKGKLQQQYDWDEENRLVASRVGGKKAEYLYEASGARTAKQGPGGELQYVSGFYSIRNGELVSKHVFVGETRVVTQLGHWHHPDTGYDAGYERKNVYYYHPDHLGSTSFVTDYQGREWEHREYTPYGEAWLEEGQTQGPIDYRFTSKEWDEETGLYYFGARYLDPRTSRWVSPDPAMEKYLPVGSTPDEARRQNGNLPGMGGVFKPVNLVVYHYAGNNPARYTDPSGADVGNPGRDEPTFSLLSPLQQKEFDRMFGFGGGRAGTVSCQTCSFFNIYAARTSAGLPFSAMERAVRAGRASGAIESEGSVGDASLLSKLIASSLGRKSYMEYIYAPPERLMQTMTESQFSASTAPAGISEEYNAQIESTHYTAVVRTESGVSKVDPLDPGRPDARGYKVIEVRPVQDLPLR